MTKFEIILSVCETHSISATAEKYNYTQSAICQTVKNFEQNGIHPQIRFYLNDDFAVQKMVESGFGIFFLPQLLLYRTPFDICVRPFTEHFQRTLGVAARKDANIYPATQKLLEYVKHWKKIPISL